MPDGGRTARRVSTALGPLRAGGLDVRLVDAVEAMEAGLVLVAAGGEFATELVDASARATVVRVHAGLYDRESELAEQLAKMADAPGRMRQTASSLPAGEGIRAVNSV